MKGTYLLVTYTIRDFNLTVGKLGNMFFEAGYYIYVGSAMGLTGTTLECRLSRHIRSVFMKNLVHKHWHIDYFLSSKYVVLKMILILPNSQVKHECSISSVIHEHSDGLIPNFGSSDCKCISHLFFFRSNNAFIRTSLGSV